MTTGLLPRAESESERLAFWGVGAASCPFGGFRLITGLFRRAENKSDRLVVQTSLAQWSFLLHSANESSSITHRALPSS